MKPEDFRASTQRPFTGEEYLKSLQDGREIYIYGERVKDVTTHPAFRNAAAAAIPINSSAWRKVPTTCASNATPSLSGHA